jgi:urease accessory protein
VNLCRPLRPALLAPLAAAASILVPAAAHAHTSAGGVDGFLHGLQHSLSGLDHLCAMLAVGLFAAQRGGRALWLVPLAFVGAMLLGGLLGASGVALPLVEQGILASVLVLGLLVAAAVRVPMAASVAVVGAFALLHGHAHGTEIPSTASGATYALGFTAAAAGLHLAGIGMG